MSDAFLKTKNERWATIREKGRLRFVLLPVVFLNILLIGVPLSVALLNGGASGVLRLGIRFIGLILLITGVSSFAVYLWMASWWRRAENAYRVGISMRTLDEHIPPVVERYDFIPKK